jgi:hypothetical protein
MVKVELKGIASATAKGRAYWYAWRGGPRLRGQPGSPEFVASYNEAIESRRAPESGRFKSLVVFYRASKEYKGLAIPLHFDARNIHASGDKTAFVRSPCLNVQGLRGIRQPRRGGASRFRQWASIDQQRAMLQAFADRSEAGSLSLLLCDRSGSWR